MVVHHQALAKDGPLRDSPRLLIGSDGDGWPQEVIWHVGFDRTESYLYRLVTPVHPDTSPVYEFVRALGPKQSASAGDGAPR